MQHFLTKRILLPLIIILIAIILIMSKCSQDPSSKKEDIVSIVKKPEEKKSFKNKRKSNSSFLGHIKAIYPLVTSFTVKFNGNIIDSDATILMQDEKTILIDSESTLKELAPLVKEDVIKTLKNKSETIKDNSWLRLDSFNLVKINATFDESLLEINLTSSIDLSPPKDLSLFSRRQNDNAIEPNALSGYVNMRAAENFTQNQNLPNERKPVLGRLDGAINLNSLVFEGSGVVSEGGEQTKRESTRVVKDFPSSLLRISAGDISFPTIGYQSYIPMMGVNLNYNFDFHQSHIATKETSRKIILTRDSTLKVLVNNTEISRMNLIAGEYNLDNIPILQGVNNAKIIITNDLGESEEIPLDYIFAPSMILKGENQISMSVGAPTILTGSTPTYDSSHVTTSIAHKIGVTKDLTSGYYYQGNNIQGLFGINSSFGTNLGLFSLDSAFINKFHDNSGIASKVNYLYSNDKNRYTLGLSLSVLSENFANDVINYGNFFGYNLVGSFTKALIANITGNIGLNYSLNEKKGYSDFYGISVGINKSWPNNMTTALTFSETQNAIHSQNSIVTFSLSWDLDRHFSTRNTIDSQKALTSSLSYNDTHGINSERLNVNLNKNDNQTLVDGSFTHQMNRGDIGVNFSETKTSSFKSDQETLSAATALVFSGNHIGITRPIYDSFIFIDTKEDVGAVTSGMQSEADLLGPPIISNITSYYPYLVRVNDQGLVGKVLVDNDFKFNPTYKSGSSVSLRFDEKYSVKGTLFDSSGNAIERTAGELIDQKNSGITYTFVSNRKGEFFIEDMVPGSYLIEIEGIKAELVLQRNNKEPIVDFGKIFLK